MLSDTFLSIGTSLLLALSSLFSQVTNLVDFQGIQNQVQETAKEEITSSLSNLLETDTPKKCTVAPPAANLFGHNIVQTTGTVYVAHTKLHATLTGKIGNNVTTINSDILIRDGKEYIWLSTDKKNGIVLTQKEGMEQQDYLPQSISTQSLLRFICVTWSEKAKEFDVPSDRIFFSSKDYAKETAGSLLQDALDGVTTKMQEVVSKSISL